ncbi:GNAT family N-acetyltransferase [Streptomyces halstedii]|uniref:GNAT family N-acetyltransferase n=1 Tax=Streptomyces halstedii TaxID=1944 RepID=UPI00380F1BA4
MDGSPLGGAMRRSHREAVVVRRFAEGDSVSQLTCLLHRAYAAHAAEGRVFFASYQSVEDTAYRLGKGECWIALRDGELVGTVTVAEPYGAPQGYPAPVDAGAFWQLAVEPECREMGLGQRLLALTEERIGALGSSQVVIDTSVQAVEPVGWYRRRGYVPVDSWRWGVTNYESIATWRWPREVKKSRKVERICVERMVVWPSRKSRREVGIDHTPSRAENRD